MVNVPEEQAAASASPPGPPDPTPPAPAPEAARRGPLQVEHHFAGDALARFASTPLDPNVPVAPLRFAADESVVELELISTGGDPDAEAHKAALMAAHPEGKPIATVRHGTRPAEVPPCQGHDQSPPDS